MSDPEPTPTSEEKPATKPDDELDEKSLEQVSGGFNPCPEPPGNVMRIVPPAEIDPIKVRRW